EAESREDASRPLLERIAELYTRGAEIDWIAFNANQASSRAIVTLPVYAFQRQDHWALDDDAPIGTGEIGAETTHDHATSDRAADAGADSVGAGRTVAQDVE